ncbi:MAG: pseudouridine synthase [Bdellovibrionota bacterium]
MKLKDQISYTSERSEPPVATNIQTIFEDEHLLVVNKPAPLPVHAQGVFILHTLIYMLRQKTNNQDLGLGHRLDRETTGIIVLAKHRELTESSWRVSKIRTQRKVIWPWFVAKWISRKS